ncbi:MAG: GDSL-type esterase/lipase family protein [Acholeplasmataceae bacterium]|nr:GDSL-type esterase/lipase family protein [Acholeplasmataceae bacterium]
MSDKGKTILVGDSMVAYLNLNKYGLSNQVVNQGIAGDTTIGVLKRLKYVTGLNPSKVILSVGSNDMVLTNLSFEETIENIVKIKKEIEDQTNTKVYVMSLTPVLRDSAITNKYYVATRTNEDIKYINLKLQNAFKETEFISIYEEFLDSKGNLDIQYTTDGIHLNHQGYEKYTHFIKNILK